MEKAVHNNGLILVFVETGKGFVNRFIVYTERKAKQISLV